LSNDKTGKITMAEEKKKQEEKKPVKYKVTGGNVKYKGTWYKEGKNIQLMEEEFNSLPEQVKACLKKGGE
jgi:hypothetical protein